MATIEDLSAEFERLSAMEKELLNLQRREERLLEVREAIEKEMKKLEKLYIKENTQRMLDIVLGSFMIAYSFTSLLVWLQ